MQVWFKNGEIAEMKAITKRDGGKALPYVVGNYLWKWVISAPLANKEKVSAGKALDE